MIKYALVFAFALTFATPALGQTTAAKEDLVPVAIDTSLGRIVVALDRTRAPLTTANFLRYVDAHRFDGEPFYRAMRVGNGGLIQGGIRSDSRKLFPPVAHESTRQTGLKNIAGTISMANAGSGTARADFFILISDMPSLDATADQPGFAAFGHVIEGMDVAKTILTAPVSLTAGEGPMRGQMLEPVVKIVRAARVK